MENTTEPELPEPRRAVALFAAVMEAKLRANEHKGGWHDNHPEELLLRAYEELGELHRELVRPTRVQGERAMVLLREAADVANMVLMVTDVCGGLTAGRVREATDPSLWAKRDGR